MARPIKFTKKEFGVSALALLLAVAGILPNEPQVFWPCLSASVICIVWLAYIHEGTPILRVLIATFFAGILLFAGYKKSNSAPFAIEVGGSMVRAQKGSREGPYIAGCRDGDFIRIDVMEHVAITNLQSVSTRISAYSMDAIFEDGTHESLVKLTRDINRDPAFAITDFRTGQMLEMTQIIGLDDALFARDLSPGSTASGWTFFSYTANHQHHGSLASTVLSVKDISGRSASSSSKEAGPSGNVPTTNSFRLGPRNITDPHRYMNYEDCN